MNVKKLLSKLIKIAFYIALYCFVIWFFGHQSPHTSPPRPIGAIESIVTYKVLQADIYLKIVVTIGIALLLFFFYSPLAVWILFLFISFFVYPALGVYPPFGDISLLLFLLILICFFLLRFALSFLFFKMALKLKLMPKISKTERIALQVGESWLEREFFTGRPNFRALLKQKPPSLSKEERAFLDKQAEEFCSLSTEWDFLKRKKLTLEEEEFIKKEKLFGLNIPKEYKGLGFSPFAHAKVIEKLAGHNIPLSIIAMVPNSLGPAELLLKYGTEKQKDQYLQALAEGRLWPCFGLTEAQAGSDASSIQSEGVLFKEGDQLKIRLNFEKRWITLSAKADLIGLAVQLKDPNQLYSEKKDLGITCVLVPSNLKGVERDFYHDPMGLPIYNAPIKGKDVIVSAESAIIGGLKGAGQGWKMLMESLSAGRSISLPSLSVACGKRVSWLAGTHAFVRKQFGRPLGKFSAIQEKLAQVTGLTQLITSAQAFTLSGLNQGIVSPVVSALTKYQLTELAQKIVKQGMDIMGGSGLSLGPKNKIALLHTALPLAITVEGANTLTRAFIVYGQGLIKTHPQAYPIVKALEDNHFKSFHKEFWSFLYQTLCHCVRSCAFTLTRAYLVWTPLFRQFLFKTFFIENLFGAFHKILFLRLPSFLRLLSFLRKQESLSKNKKQDQYKGGRYLQRLAWSSSLFAFLSNLNLLFLGRQLKTNGPINGRFADWLSFQYMISAVLWQNKNEKTEWLASQWALEYCFSQIQNNAMDILNNYPVAVIRWLLKPLAWLLRINPLGLKPSDKMNKKLAHKILEDKKFKRELCDNMYFSNREEDQFQKLNRAYDLSLKEREIINKVKQFSINVTANDQAYKSTNRPDNYSLETRYGKLQRPDAKAGSKKQLFIKHNKINFDLCQRALKSDVISQEEFDTLQLAQKAQWEAIQADVFSKEEYFKN